MSLTLTKATSPTYQSGGPSTGEIKGKGPMLGPDPSEKLEKEIMQMWAAMGYNRPGLIQINDNPNPLQHTPSSLAATTNNYPPPPSSSFISTTINPYPKEIPFFTPSDYPITLPSSIIHDNSSQIQKTDSIHFTSNQNAQNSYNQNKKRGRPIGATKERCLARKIANQRNDLLLESPRPKKIGRRSISKINCS
ncbi:hypothetical protein FRX31_030878 [Thalictrum thalictroides]|uniref:Uncharacterized protein n=1 Tax=Thalictrum thalictroides TaxID=46969 RepID=A0A7J6V4E9_THATH|nr:hypothetical protein FRX31_030878 [Thalictrum thalictroides]